MTRVITKTGDIFSAEINGGYKKFFQYVSNDLTQLNSNVIRAFKQVYPVDATPDPSEIVNDEIDFYAHCVIKFGLKMKLWEKVDNTIDIGNLTEVLFRESEDYGTKPGENPVLLSHHWYVWKINRSFTRVGKLEGPNKKAYIGLVFNPYGIIELLKGNKYPVSYPGYE